MASRPVAPAPRPLSPHLTIWKWKVHMAVSILHRATGNALAFGAVLIFTWWLSALAGGPDYYRVFRDVVISPLGAIVAMALTWVVFQHMASGVRHLIMDTGEGLEIHASRRMAMGTFVFSGAATLGLWAFIITGKGL